VYRPITIYINITYALFGTRRAFYGNVEQINNEEGWAETKKISRLKTAIYKKRGGSVEGTEYI
jgi:hypothetical protein